MPPSPDHHTKDQHDTEAVGQGRLRLVASIHAALPQTQCTRCGFPDCLGYAEAIAAQAADINRCPPGGAEGVARLSQLTGLAAKPLDPEHGQEGPRALALIDEAWCIGCTLCIKACPVDCIVGAPKRMHTVIEAQCTGCELCVPVCPVDCISMPPASGSRTGWQAWSGAEAQAAHGRYAARGQRLGRDKTENDARLAARAQAKLDDLAAHSAITDPAVLAAKRAVIEAALARATQGAEVKQRGPGLNRGGNGSSSVSGVVDAKDAVDGGADGA